MVRATKSIRALRVINQDSREPVLLSQGVSDQSDHSVAELVSRICDLLDAEVKSHVQSMEAEMDTKIEALNKDLELLKSMIPNSILDMDHELFMARFGGSISSALAAIESQH
eukprot:TRINITY_DN8591_c0_g1_i4.p1 TRINITY_DN8591_c0_g1~~TRINITY_DN8591_c0_g1_i4.p1  ORF type:complete len:121 (-),score=4.79 TRINITY_DN8591_c0_g1_i4:133-468(-)